MTQAAMTQAATRPPDSSSPPASAPRLRAEPATTALRAPDGHTAALEGDDLVMRDPQGRQVVRYAPATGLRIEAPDGDLTFAAPKGKVVIEAATDLQLGAGRRASLRAESSHLETQDATIVASRIETRARELVQLLGRYELRAQRLVESVNDAYREVEGVSQLRAGRVRQLVRGACQLFADNTSIVSERDTSVDGDRVLLG